MRFWNVLPFMDPRDAIELARVSDESGYHGVAVPDHLFYPRELKSKYPYQPDGKPAFTEDSPWPDPWVLIGAMASHTTRLHFTTNIYVAPARDLFTVAKAVSTAAVLADGRVALGVGAGWMREEFDQTGQDFDTRGKRLNEMLPALRKLWTGDWAEFHGQYYDFDALKISPVPSDPIPIWIGGHSPAALRRAAELADGWIGIDYTLEDAEGVTKDLRDRVEAAGRASDRFEIILAVWSRIDRDLCKRLEDLGVTGLLCAPWMREQELGARVDAVRRWSDKVIAGIG